MDRCNPQQESVAEAMNGVRGTFDDPAEEPDAVAAIAEGCQQMRDGEGRPFDEFAREFVERFEDHRQSAA